MLTSREMKPHRWPRTVSRPSSDGSAIAPWNVADPKDTDESLAFFGSPHRSDDADYAGHANE
jgi:hypothetical protein